jgi:hypothetical protein
MKMQLRNLVAGALYPTKAYDLPALCERYGLDPGEESEAFSSKTQYVLRRLKKLPEARVLQIAKLVSADVDDDDLRAAVEQLGNGRLLSEISRIDGIPVNLISLEQLKISMFRLLSRLRFHYAMKHDDVLGELASRL